MKPQHEASNIIQWGRLKSQCEVLNFRQWPSFMLYETPCITCHIRLRFPDKLDDIKFWDILWKNCIFLKLGNILINSKQRALMKIAFKFLIFWIYVNMFNFVNLKKSKNKKFLVELMWLIKLVQMQCASRCLQLQVK